jgi:hypothetical protein
VVQIHSPRPNSVESATYNFGNSNSKSFPDGSKIVKLKWKPKKLTDPPFAASTPGTVPGDLTEVEFFYATLHLKLLGLLAG